MIYQNLYCHISLAFDSCPLDWRLENILSWAADLIESIGESDIPDGKTRESIRQEVQDLVREKPSEDLVFTHGDYCLPNILILDGRLSGFVDWGYAGIGDRYLDFVGARGSIERNLGPDWVSLFLREYGLEELDEKRSKYYQRVFDLFEEA